MHSLDINLASRPFRNNSLLWAGYGLATLLLALSTAWMIHTYIDHARLLRDVRQQVGDFESESDSLRRRANGAQVAIDRYDLKSLTIRAEKANEVIDWKAFSWTRLFNIMAEIQPYYVRMTSIRPIFRSERRGDDQLPVAQGERLIPVSIQGVAKSITAIGELETALLADPHFRRVEPERFVRAENGELNFELRFYYYPEAVPAVEQQLADAEAASAAEDAEVAGTDAAGKPGSTAPGQEAAAAPLPKVTVVEVEEGFPGVEEPAGDDPTRAEAAGNDPAQPEPAGDEIARPAPQRPPAQPTPRGKRSVGRRRAQQKKEGAASGDDQ
jgi:hypothetical protein